MQKGVDRWIAVTREAAKQSMRPWLPDVLDLVTTKQLARLASETRMLVLEPTASTRLTALDLDGRDLLVVVGPEGGLSPDEVDALAAAGAEPVRLGDEVLRTSTAGPGRDRCAERETRPLVSAAPEYTGNHVRAIDLHAHHRARDPAEILFENERVIAIRDINPQAPVHLLVIPKVRSTRLSSNSPPPIRRCSPRSSRSASSSRPSTGTASSASCSTPVHPPARPSSMFMRTS